jgi:hypothetical protein
MEQTAQRSDQQQEVTVRNPIQKSFGAGINQPKVIPNKKRKDRKVKHRNRWREDNSCGAIASQEPTP